MSRDGFSTGKRRVLTRGPAQFSQIPATAMQQTILPVGTGDLTLPISSYPTSSTVFHYPALHPGVFSSFRVLVALPPEACSLQAELPMLLLAAERGSSLTFVPSVCSLWLAQCASFEQWWPWLFMLTGDFYRIEQRRQRVPQRSEEGQSADRHRNRFPGSCSPTPVSLGLKIQALLCQATAFPGCNWGS